MHVYGLNGNDNITGNSGNDTLEGGSGDYAHGYGGHDVFIYTAGLDTVEDNGGADTLWLIGGLTINDITIADWSWSKARITITASLDEIIVNEVRSGNSTFYIETLKFDDGFETDQLPNCNSWLKGTSGNDSALETAAPTP